MNKHLITCMVMVMLCHANTNAQEYGHAQYDRVQKAIHTGSDFIQQNLFSETTAAPSNYVTQYVALQPLQDNIQLLYAQKHKAINLPVSTADGKTYVLEMVQSQPTSTDAQMGVVDERGRHRINYDHGLHYQGALKGYQKSVAAMSVFANGEVMIFFSNNDGNFNLGKINDNSGLYTLYNSNDRLEHPAINCDTKGGEMDEDALRAENKGTGDIECRKVRIYWECAYSIFQFKGSLAATQSYMIGLFNFMQSIYYNDGMAIEMSSLYVWTAPDPYPTENALNALPNFSIYWQSQNHSFYGDIAGLITDTHGWQGIANLNALCSSGKYSVSNIVGQQSVTFPTFDIDIYLTAHETGHNVGAEHTHACSWKTGPGGTCGAIDNCTSPEWGGGCSTCSSLYDRNDPGFKGTIMSYCGGDIDLSLGFGAIIAPYLRNKVANAACLKTVISPELTPRNICNNDGAVMLSFTDNNFGVAPYTYSWSGGQKTKDISNLSTPGIYTVTIIDSNSCSTIDSATIGYFPKPGDGQALQGSMPFCCKDTSFAVTLNATLPTALADCQTVGWLRTNAPVTSFAAAKAAYDNASSTDILFSNNDTSINNTTAAALTIKSPDSCNTTTTSYYTPFVAHVSRDTIVYTVNSTGSTNIIVFGKKVQGRSVTLPDQRQLLADCDKNEQPEADTITVTISNYTGRKDSLTIRVTGADNKMLYWKRDYPGDGVYKIPITDSIDHLQEMTVHAFDHNCPKVQSCIACNVAVQATRHVYYPAIPALRLDSGCVAGTSVALSFGPDSCKVVNTPTVPKTGVSHTQLYPNPTTGKAVLEFTATQKGTIDIQLTDITGKVIDQYPVQYNTGNNRTKLNLVGYASGVYFINMINNGNMAQHLRLIVK